MSEKLDHSLLDINPMGNYFDVNATLGGQPAQFKIAVEDYNEYGVCYLVFCGALDLGYFCRLPNGEYKFIDHSELTLSEITEIGDQVEGARNLRIAS